MRLWNEQPDPMHVESAPNSTDVNVMIRFIPKLSGHAEHPDSDHLSQYCPLQTGSGFPVS